MANKVTIEVFRLLLLYPKNTTPIKPTSIQVIYSKPISYHSSAKNQRRTKEFFLFFSQIRNCLID